MRSKLKTMTIHAMMISFFILVGISVESLIAYFMGRMLNLPWHLPISIVGLGILCAIPSLLIMDVENLRTRQYMLRVVLHFLCLATIVLGAGRIFDWYEDVRGAAIIFAVFVGVYAAVWIGSYRLLIKDTALIDKALENYRDDE